MPFFNHVCEFTTECPDRLKEIKNTTNNCKDNISVGLSVIKILHRKSLFCRCCDFSEHKKTVTNEVKKKEDNIAHSDTDGWILRCRLMPKNCQTWRLWYLYLDGICASMEVQCQCFKPRDHEALSHERTMNLMRFGSVVVNRLICLGPWRLSQCLLGCG